MTPARWDLLKSEISRKIKSGTSAIHRWGSVCGVVNNLIKYPEKFKQPDQFIGTLGDLYDIHQGADPNIVLAKPGNKATTTSKKHVSVQTRQLASTSESHIIESAIDVIASLRMDERYGGSASGRGIWYHGTTTKHLNSIMKNGLIPDPKEKGYGSGYSGNTSRPELVSYGGVYLTNNLGKASLAATSVASQQGRKYNPVIVVMEVQPRTLIADEDDITTRVSQVNPTDLINSAQVASWILMAVKYSLKSPNLSDQSKQEMIQWVKKAKQTYIERSMSKLGYMITRSETQKLHRELENKLISALENMWMPAVERATAYFEKEHGQYWRQSWLKNLRQYTGNEDIQRENMPLPPSAKESEAVFRQHVDGLTRLIKKHLQQKDRWLSARSMQPIGFKGSNRIVAIVEEVLGDDKKSAMRVRYGKPPKSFLDAWRENIGDIQYIEDQKPRIIFNR